MLGELSVSSYQLSGVGEDGEDGGVSIAKSFMCRGGFHYYRLKWCVTLR